MLNRDGISRRDFVRAGMAGAAVMALAGVEAPAIAGPTKPVRDPFDGLKVGLTSYSMRNFSLDQAIAMAVQARVKYISLKDVHLPVKSTTEERRAAHKKVEEAGLTLMGGGVLYFGANEAQIRGVFDYARDAGMSTIVCSPDPAAMDTLEKVAKQYEMRVAIHNHGPGDKHYPSPLDVLRMVKDRDMRLGVCMDVGHTVRNGEDPVVTLEQCAPRLYEFHMKDVNAATGRGAPVEVGRGVIDIVEVLRTLVRLKYPYHVALEFEAHGDAPMPGIIESLAYIRGVLATFA